MMGADINDGGRGVSRQAAGYPIMLGVLLHPFPSTLPSSQIQPEASRGQAGSSLWHYPSITCHPPSTDNRIFSFLLTLYVWHQLQLFMISHPEPFTSFLTLPLWFSHRLAPHLFPVHTPSLASYYLLFWQPCTTLSLPLSFSLTDSEKSGVPLPETFCWDFSCSLHWYRDIHPLLPSQTDCRLSLLLSVENLCWGFSKRVENERYWLM